MKPFWNPISRRQGTSGLQESRQSPTEDEHPDWAKVGRGNLGKHGPHVNLPAYPSFDRKRAMNLR
jgi:hypothetical protein